MDQWERFARWYDLDQGIFEGDVPLYLALAQRTGSPILELGCGTGRLVLALAHAGYRVTGVDNVPAMLDLAQRKVRTAGPEVTNRIRLLAEDFCHLALEEEFHLAILATNTFMYLADPQEQSQVLSVVFQHLARGGLLALDLFHPHPAALTPAEGEICLEKILSDPETSQVAHKFVARQVDHAQQTISITLFYDQIDPQGQVIRTVVSYPLRYLHRPEAEQMLQTAGFIIEGVHGTYELGPYQDEGERMLFLARRPA